MAQGTTISKSLFSIFITGGKMTTLGKPKSELAGANLSGKGATAPPSKKEENTGKRKNNLSSFDAEKHFSKTC